MAESELRISVRAAGGHPLIALQGRLTPDCCDALRARVTEQLAARPAKLLLELTGLGHVSSCGVGTLLWIQEDSRNAGCRLLVVNDNPQIRRVLELTGLDQHFTLARTAEEALGTP
jgi:anti-anti-sigma factor